MNILLGENVDYGLPPKPPPPQPISTFPFPLHPELRPNKLPAKPQQVISSPDTPTPSEDRRTFLSAFHTVHGVLKPRILKWFAFAFSSGPRFVRTLHHDPSILGLPAWHSS